MLENVEKLEEYRFFELGETVSLFGHSFKVITINFKHDFVKYQYVTLDCRPGCCTRPFGIRIESSHIEIHRLLELRITNKEEGRMSEFPEICPHCGKDRCVPTVTKRHTEAYGRGVRHFRCVHCDKYIRAVGAINIFFHGFQKSDHSDWS